MKETYRKRMATSFICFS